MTNALKTLRLGLAAFVVAFGLLALPAVAGAQVAAPDLPQAPSTTDAPSSDSGASSQQSDQPAHAAQTTCPPGTTNTDYCSTQPQNCPPGTNNPAYCNQAPSQSQGQQQQGSSSQNPSGSTPSGAAAPSSSGVSPGTAGATAGSTLPRTGGHPMPVALAGLLLIALGLPLAWAARRRRSPAR